MLLVGKQDALTAARPYLRGIAVSGALLFPDAQAARTGPAGWAIAVFLVGFAAVGGRSSVLPDAEHPTTAIYPRAGAEFGLGGAPVRPLTVPPPPTEDGRARSATREGVRARVP